VVPGDVGQTFGYAAKGASVFILGNAAGRPLINAVGRPRRLEQVNCKVRPLATKALQPEEAWVHRPT